MMNDNKSKVYSVEIDKCNELLPIDTIVNVGVVGQSVMIYGRMQRQADQEGVWDYLAFPYPQGYLSDEMNIFLIMVILHTLYLKDLSRKEKYVYEKIC